VEPHNATPRPCSRLGTSACQSQRPGPRQRARRRRAWRSAGSGGLEGSWRAKAAESRGGCKVRIARQGVAGTMMPLVGGCGHRAGGQRLSSLFPLHSRAKSSRSKKRHGCLTPCAVGQFSIRFWVRNPNRNRFPQTDSDSESVTGVKFVRSALRNGSGRRTRRGGAGVFTDERCRNLASDSMT
jgi:hypothetical protein